MATIKPPKYIYVAGMRIPINVKEELPGSLAEYDVNILRDKQLFRSTIVHELIHCALDLAGVSFNMPTKTEEQIVTAVESLAAPAIVRVWRL